MNELSKHFEKLYRSESSRYSTIVKNESLVESVALESDSTREPPHLPVDEYELQRIVRPWFGKIGINDTKIGTHPDFIDLEQHSNKTISHHVCTMFVDIKGSTRLALLYDLEKVYQFKNTVLKACIEVIRALDGCVHRLMGDAVMAFFGRSNQSKEQSIADAINCSITLKIFLEFTVKQWMKLNDFDEQDFGFRIGCDFGDDSEVLWGGFGYKNVGEVTATGLPVDMASKLQNQADKDHIMLGQGLIDFAFWPDEFSAQKEKYDNGKTELIPYVTPQITDKNNSPLNYKMRHLNFDKYIRVLAIPRKIRVQISRDIIANPDIFYDCHVKDDNTKYISASRYLNKRLSIEFKVRASTKGRLKFPLKVLLTKNNYGKDVPLDQLEQDYERVQTIYKTKNNNYINPTKPFEEVVFDEATAYRGIHTMKCEVRDSSKKLIFRDWIGVMIK